MQCLLRIEGRQQENFAVKHEGLHKVKNIGQTTNLCIGDTAEIFNDTCTFFIKLYNSR